MTTGDNTNISMGYKTITQTIDGAHHLNRVVFTDVRVPLSNRIGEEGKAWNYSRALLAYERTSYARLGTKRRDIDTLHRRIHEQDEGDGAQQRLRLAETDIIYRSLEATALRALAPLAAGQAPGQESSLLKILATETAQAITERQLEFAGESAIPYAADRSGADWADGIGGADKNGPLAAISYFATRSETIYGGATEIQKNIIARQLGL